MKVVLRADVDNVGKKGDILDVADGFARNYLIPKGHAFRATKGVEKQAASMRRSRDVQDAKEREAGEAVARVLVPTVVRIPPGPGPRAGSSARSPPLTWSKPSRPRPASSSTVAKVHLDEPIKSLGTHEVPVKLHSDVEFRITVEVVAE